MIPYPFETRLCEHYVTGGRGSARKWDQRGHGFGKGDVHGSEFVEHVIFWKRNWLERLQIWRVRRGDLVCAFGGGITVQTKADVGVAILCYR